MLSLRIFPNIDEIKDRSFDNGNSIIHTVFIDNATGEFLDSDYYNKRYFIDALGSVESGEILEILYTSNSFESVKENIYQIFENNIIFIREDGIELTSFSNSFNRQKSHFINELETIKKKSENLLRKVDPEDGYVLTFIEGDSFIEIIRKFFYGLSVADGSENKYLALKSKLSIVYGKLEMLSDFSKKEIELAEKSYIRYFFFGMAEFIFGYHNKAYKSFQKSLKLMKGFNGSGLRYTMNRIINSLSSMRSRDVGNELMKRTFVALFNFDDFSEPDLTHSTNVIDAISSTVPSSKIINVGFYNNKDRVMQVLNEGITSNSIIFLIGHGSEKGYTLFKKPKNSIKFTKNDLVKIFIKKDNIICMDFTCTDGHFNDDYNDMRLDLKNKWNVIFSKSYTYDARSAEAYCLGFLNSYSQNLDIKDANYCGQLILSFLGPNYNDLQWRNG